MKTFNAIQMVIFLMLSPVLLQLCRGANFMGANVVFWIGLLGSIGLFIWTVFLVRVGMDD